MQKHTQTKKPLWFRLWQPFFSLSIYQKYLVVLASFLLGYLVLGLHSLFFVKTIKQALAESPLHQEQLSTVLTLLNTYITHSEILVLIIMVVLSICSFLTIRVLVEILNQMTRSLQLLLNKNGDKSISNHATRIPVLTGDKIGEVATLVNNLTSHIRDISLFRRTIEADETVAEVYDRLAYVFKETLNLKTFIIWEIQEQDDVIEAVYTWPPELEYETCTMSTSTICRARRTGETISSAGVPNICSVFPLSDEMTHTCVPMIVSGKVLGVVQFFSLFVDSSEREIELLQSQHLAKMYMTEALPVLYAKHLASSLHEMATKDPMTGLANRRFLETGINQLIAGVQRRNSTLGVLMCDLDFFKKVNDEHGHDVGDHVLKTLAVILQASVRASDIAIRYGGEEFLILLTDCETEKAIEVAEKIRVAVEEQQFRMENLTIRKTLSIGISIFPTDGEDFWECVKHADVALFQAKERGRNKVLRFESSMWSQDSQ